MEENSAKCKKNQETAATATVVLNLSWFVAP